MAGQSLGAPSPVNLPQASSPGRILQLVPSTSTRTRREHGAFVHNGHGVRVYSTRQRGRHYGVTLAFTTEQLMLSSLMNPGQALALSVALAAAAKAAQEIEQGGAA